MRKVTLFVALIISIYCGCSSAITGHGMLHHQTTDPNVPLPVKEIACTMGKSVATWEQAKDFFARCGRQSGQERWELNPVKLSQGKKEEINKQLEALGFIQAINAQEKLYNHAVILGGTVKNMAYRLNYLVQQWHAGVRFSHLVFLTGDRPLTAESDDIASFISEYVKQTPDVTPDKSIWPNSESEAAQFIYHYFPTPKEMHDVTVYFISVPRTLKATADGKKVEWQRPNTAMTIEKWIAEKKPAGSILVVSSQPHAHYQHQVVLNLFSADHHIETIAPACSDTTSLAVKLDALWLWIKNHR